ncbi:hypothetical protein MB02_04430 [Croceicoccus estronivorus]|uniref:phage holin family protein n=1 Tax=Croceicoccus estronivorus TaxID=1172626 RepID=UPI00082F5897|nr:phage holin family protein [Croceicoccus estronivorus]OCC24730.1 hypothetical protein MB02_04430 [Croceicoccus estronivorus]
MDERDEDAENLRHEIPDQQNESLFDDVSGLIDDGRTLIEAELAYQKTRFAYAGRRGRNAVVFGILAAILAVFALFGLVVGAILALTPHFTAWGATGVVAGLLLISGILFALLAARNARLIAKVFKEGE